MKARRRPESRSARTIGSLLILATAGFVGSTGCGGDRADGVEAAPAPGWAYLGNMGVLLEAGDRAVVVDALFGDGLADYPVVPPATRDSLERALGRFADVDAVLVTHVHDDHFDPEAVARHLEHNPGAVLVGPEAVAAELETAVGERYVAIADRVLGITPPYGARVAVDGLPVEVVRIRHTSPRNRDVENLGFVVDLGGWRALHVGDAFTIDADFPDAIAGTIDTALLPFWLVIEPAHLADVRARIDPGAIVALHLPVEGTERWVERIRTADPAVEVPGS